MYDAEVSRELISRVTDSVLADREAWRQRPLDRIYPVLFIDALMMKIRQGRPGAGQPAVHQPQGLAEDHPRPTGDLHRPTVAAAETRFQEFAAEFGDQYPTVINL